MSDYIKNKDYVGDVVSFDRPRLPDLTGKKVVHLQCHIGTDTLGLARLGAASVTGLDFSGPAIAEARKLAEATSGSGGEKLTYVEASVYDAAKVLEAGSFDVVFTGIGALCWIHSIEEWATVVSKLLKPGGRLFIREGHPVLWALDETDKEKLSIKFPYFERKDPTVWEFENTYVQTDHVFKTNKTNEFNHGIGEIVQAVINSGMRLTNLEEHQSVPWNALPEMMVADGNGKL